MAIDRESLTKALTFGYAEIANTVLPRALLYQTNDTVNALSYDIDAAKEELAQSAYPDGFDTTISIASGNNTRLQEAQIIQAAGAAVYTEEGKKETKEQIAYYMNNAKIIREGLTGAGYEVYGGVDAPYIWLKTPDKMTSWEFFDYLLEKLNIVGTPGSGFGPSGEGYFRLTAFGSLENTKKAMERIKAGKA